MEKFKNRYSNEKSLALEDLINVFSIKNCNFFLIYNTEKLVRKF